MKSWVISDSFATRVGSKGKEGGSSCHYMIEQNRNQQLEGVGNIMAVQVKGLGFKRQESLVSLGVVQVFVQGGNGQLVDVHLDRMARTVKECLRCDRQINLAKISAQTPREERPVANQARTGFYCSKDCEHKVRRGSRRRHAAHCAAG